MSKSSTLRFIPYTSWGFTHISILCFILWRFKKLRAKIYLCRYILYARGGHSFWGSGNCVSLCGWCGIWNESRTLNVHYSARYVHKSLRKLLQKINNTDHRKSLQILSEFGSNAKQST